MNNVYETQQFFGFADDAGNEVGGEREVCTYEQFLQALTEQNRGWSHDGYFRFFINGLEVADYLEATEWGDYGVALNVKEEVEFVKPLRSDCEHCCGYGYTEAVSANWTMLDFLEYLCPHCEEETF